MQKIDRNEIFQGNPKKIKRNAKIENLGREQKKNLGREQKKSFARVGASRGFQKTK